MFKNSGKKIQGLVKFIFGLNMVLAILAVVGFTLYAYTQTNDWMRTLLAAVVGVLAMVLYMLLVFVSLLGAYAFGELAQSNVELRCIVAEMQSSMERHPAQREPSVRVVPRAVAPQSPAPVVQETVPEQPVPVPPVIQEPAVEQPQERPMNFAYDYRGAAGAPVFPVSGRSQEAPAPAAPGVSICSKCGGKHDAGVNFCRYCGTPLQ